MFIYPKYIHLTFSEIQVARFGFPDGKDGSNLEILRIAETGKSSKKKSLEVYWICHVIFNTSEKNENKERQSYIIYLSSD